MKVDLSLFVLSSSMIPSSGLKTGTIIPFKRVRFIICHGYLLSTIYWFPVEEIPFPGHRAAFCSHKLARSEGTCTTLSVFTSFETNVKFMPKPAFELAGIEKSLL